MHVPQSLGLIIFFIVKEERRRRKISRERESERGE